MKVSLLHLIIKFKSYVLDIINNEVQLQLLTPSLFSGNLFPELALRVKTVRKCCRFPVT